MQDQQQADAVEVAAVKVAARGQCREEVADPIRGLGRDKAVDQGRPDDRGHAPPAADPKAVNPGHGQPAADPEAVGHGRRDADPVVDVAGPWA